AQLRRVGLADKAALSAGNLSYGDQRRLEIARALAAQPTILMLDEPAAGMNHVEATELSTLIRELAADGIAVVLIEHNVRMMMKACDEILVLNFGKMIASGKPEAIARDEAVMAAYLGDAARAEDVEETNSPGAFAPDRSAQNS
ncbi:ATP-binding cassette domain-containing protein, partial [Brevibacterium sp.]|uniref:ATP-binding cassette domain-containing protein n=1 Tax=Brevibacterium sp. TaxID=1701 RepID=UPI002647D0FD